MKCPHYEGESRCGFKSQFYEVTLENVKDYCKSNYRACDIFIKGAKEHLKNAKSGVEEKVKK